MTQGNWIVSKETTWVETAAGRIAVRMDGSAASPALLLCQRFRGTMDDWDPELVARLARRHRVIRFDSVGVGQSAGQTPSNVGEMAQIAAGVAQAISDTPIDVLGWSLGGYVAQMLALDHADCVRRLVVAGSGPGGPNGPPPHPRVAEIAAQPHPGAEEVAFLFFPTNEAGVAASRRHFERIQFGQRPPVSAQCGQRQREAVLAWWRGDGAARSRLVELRHPVLVANGIADVMVPAEHSFALCRGAPNARLVIYPAAGHGFLFQLADAFADETSRFLQAPKSPRGAPHRGLAHSSSPPVAAPAATQSRSHHGPLD